MTSYDSELQMHTFLKTPSFEGWYVRFVSDTISVAVIIGLASSKTKQEAFVQVFHTLGNIVEKVHYDRQDFDYKEHPFIIRIHDCVLTKHYIHIEDKRLSIVIDIQFPNIKHHKQTRYAPTIMGPFSYLKKMECNHAIINLESRAFGTIQYNDKDFLVQGFIYQEKDWGTSFPSKYIWIQSNQCLEKKAILFLSCATIPFKVFSFTGIIMTLMIEDKQYCFATYYGAMLKEAVQEEDGYRLCIRQGTYDIDCYFQMESTFVLDAPHNGSMNRTVEECLLGNTNITLYKYKQCLAKLTFEKCGIENDHFFE